jgi:hypothetical protein
MSIAEDLRSALAAVGIIPDGVIGVRGERRGRHQWIRAMFSLNGREYDVHALARDWPPAATIASGLRRGIDRHEKIPLNGSKQMVIDRIRENRGAADEKPPEMISLP